MGLGMHRIDVGAARSLSSVVAVPVSTQSRLSQLSRPAVPLIGLDVQVPSDRAEETTLNVAKLLDGKTSQLAPSTIGKVLVLEELGRNHDGSEEIAARAA